MEVTNTLLEQLKPDVLYHASKLRPLMLPNMHFNDLVQAGYEGVLQAARRYDESGGASFKTYAAMRIRGAMLDEIRRQAWGNRYASVFMLSAEAMPGHEYQQVVGDTGDYLPRQSEQKALLDDTLTALQTLTEKEQKVINGYYLEEKELKDIGSEMGVTQSRASQIRSASIKQLRELLAPWLEQENNNNDH